MTTLARRAARGEEGNPYGASANRYFPRCPIASVVRIATIVGTTANRSRKTTTRYPYFRRVPPTPISRTRLSANRPAWGVASRKCPGRVAYRKYPRSRRSSRRVRFIRPRSTGTAPRAATTSTTATTSSALCYWVGLSYRARYRARYRASQAISQLSSQPVEGIC